MYFIHEFQLIFQIKLQSSATTRATATTQQRENWGNDLEFLMSCIAMSVGLGNVWRFPFTALENGGGAFLIPYLIVLAIIGRPLYYMEMIIGQFSSRGSIKVFDMVPALRGKFSILLKLRDLLDINNKVANNM